MFRSQGVLCSAASLPREYRFVGSYLIILVEKLAIARLSGRGDSLLVVAVATLPLALGCRICTTLLADRSARVVQWPVLVQAQENQH